MTTPSTFPSQIPPLLNSTLPSQKTIPCKCFQSFSRKPMCALASDCQEKRAKTNQRGGEGGAGEHSGEDAKANSLRLPLKPVKFPQSSSELLKEGRDTLKNKSVPLGGFRMVSVNRFICSRVLIR